MYSSKNNMINELKAKKNRVIQSSNEILCEVDKKKEEADLQLKTKNNIETEFKKYIQNMNDAATNILRDYEENVKVKQIWTIIQSTNDLIFDLNYLMILRPRNFKYCYN